MFALQKDIAPRICYTHKNLTCSGQPTEVYPTYAANNFTMLTPSSFPTIFRRFLSVTALGALVLGGCGDVQGAEDALTLQIDGRGSTYLAVQDGVQNSVQNGVSNNLSVWQPLAPGADAPSQITLTDPQGRYGVLSLCLDKATGNLSVNVEHGVVSETPTVSANCLADSVGKTFSVAGEVRGLTEGEYGNVYLGRTSALVDSAAPRGRLELPLELAEVRYDLVASRYAGSARVPSRLVIEPDVAVTAAPELTVDFNGPFSFQPEVARLLVAGVRPRELLSGSVELVTGETAARVGEYTGGNALFYARIPQRLVGRWGRGVTFRAAVQSFSYNDRTKAGSSRSLSRTLPNTPKPNIPKAPARIKLPEPLEPPALTFFGGRDVRPQTSWQLHPAGQGTYTQFYSQIQDGHTVSYRLVQSSAWLAGRAPSYTLPDLNALPDWQRTWNLRRGEALFWDVSFTQQTPVKELSVSRSGVTTPN